MNFEKVNKVLEWETDHLLNTITIDELEKLDLKTINSLMTLYHFLRLKHNAYDMLELEY